MTPALFCLGLHLQRRCDPAHRAAARLLVRIIRAERRAGRNP